MTWDHGQPRHSRGPLEHTVQLFEAAVSEERLEDICAVSHLPTRGDSCALICAPEERQPSWPAEVNGSNETKSLTGLGNDAANYTTRFPLFCFVMTSGKASFVGRLEAESKSGEVIGR